jgi:hypothetical protein
MLVFTVGIAPADTSCVKPRASVTLQEDREMVRTGSELGDKTNQYVAAVAIADPSHGPTHERMRNRSAPHER